MNRDIRFNAWDKVDKKMLRKNVAWRFKSERGKIVSFHYPKWPALPNHRFVLLQFTGIKDKNNVDIFEGDIVTRMCFDEFCPNEHKGYVMYSEHWCTWMVKDRDDLMREVSGYYPPLAFGNTQKGILAPIEIIGNVFESPELLDFPIFAEDGNMIHT